MLTLYKGVGFYLFDCKVFGDTEEANKGKSPHSFYALSITPKLLADNRDIKLTNEKDYEKILIFIYYNNHNEYKNICSIYETRRG